MIDFVVSFKHHMTGEAWPALIMDTGALCPGDNLDFSNSGAIGQTEKSTCAKYEVISCDISETVG